MALQCKETKRETEVQLVEDKSGTIGYFTFISSFSGIYNLRIVGASELPLLCLASLLLLLLPFPSSGSLCFSLHCDSCYYLSLDLFAYLLLLCQYCMVVVVLWSSIYYCSANGQIRIKSKIQMLLST